MHYHFIGRITCVKLSHDLIVLNEHQSAIADLNYIILLMLELYLPLHSTSLGSGSHSPFPMQLALLGPISNLPLGHVNEALVPTRAGSLSTSTLKLLSVVSNWRG